MGFWNTISAKTAEQPNIGKVISFLNQKGGVGKTTLSFNFAAAMAKQGKRVLMIDSDPQGNLGLLLGSDPEATGLFTLMINSVKELKGLHRPVLLDNAIQPFDEGGISLDFISSGQELSGFELTVAGIKAPRPFVLRRFLKQSGLLQRYDVIVIDGPPTLGLIVVNIMCASQGVFIPFQPDHFSEQGLHHFYESLQELSDMEVEPPKILGLIPNLVDERRKQVKSDFDRIKKQEEGLTVYPSFANRNVFVRSSSQKKTVFGYRAKEFHEIQHQFEQLAHDACEQLWGEPAQSSERYQ